MSKVRIYGLGLAVFLGLMGPMTEQTAEARLGERDFVYTEGPRFKLNGQDFYFQGTNLPGLADLGAHSESTVYQTLSRVAAEGMRVVRFWGYSCGDRVSRPMIRWVSEHDIGYDGEALWRLDVALDAARSANLKVILTLINFEPEYCGMDWWAHQVTGVWDKHRFYWDDRVKRSFERHVSTLLHRENGKYRQRYGISVEYRNDPTILSIEVANEPHTTDWLESSARQTPGVLVHGWLRHLSDYVRGIDDKHLISSGEEGYKTGHSGDRGRHAWIHNGSKGIDFDANVTIPNINFVTAHIYPDNWRIPSGEMDWVREQLVLDRARIARAAGKPIVLEETGFSLEGRFSWAGYQGDRAGWLRRMYAFANEADYAGTMIWSAVPPGYESSHGYVFDFDDPAFAVVREQAAYMNGRSGGGSGGPSDDVSAGLCTGRTDSDPDRDGWGWENERSCRFVYCSNPSSDTDRDGWGWDAGTSCRIPSCLGAGSDPDGDGWGWESGRSCLAR